jgi:CheY-like chemotaxis protein
LARQLGAHAILANMGDGPQHSSVERLLRDQLAGVTVPIIVTQLVGDHTLASALQVMAYLHKPVTREALSGLLDRLDKAVRRVLIVDDDTRIAQAYTRLLMASEKGLEITRAANGKEALESMRAQPPDLVLLDLMMPEMDGYATLMRMREEPQLRSVPVTVITGKPSAPEEQRTLNTGTMVISKPEGFTNEETLNCLRAVIDAIGQPSAPTLPGSSIV